MTTTTKALRRSLYAAFAVSAVGGASVAALMGNPAPSATAASDPCAASELARTIGSVAISTGNYLDSHPETNQALTTISQQQGTPLAGGLPGALQTAQTLGVPSAAVPASPSPGSAVSQGSGPLPGPSATTTR
jgi:hemophore-related protein